ncbi:MAG: ribosome maturation factor RimP [Firmicutes bacterium]|nr:ribosome maturation factor RimP [Bacillota bacterium]MCL5040157.1 ribosome maturation factor RimP [Bacillota bacterium]
MKGRFNRREIEERVHGLAEAITQFRHFELVAVEMVQEAGNWFLRVFIDRPGGISLEECEVVNRELSGKLDELDLIPGNYFLEVASPGLERPLRKDNDFERFRGRRVEVKTFAPVEGRKVFVGDLQGLVEERVILMLEEGKEVAIPKEKVASARLRPEL